MNVCAFAWLALVAGAAYAKEEPPAGSAEQIAQLERERDKRPRKPERRDALGIAYYQYARAAFDRGEFAEYEKYLGKAMDEWIESLRLAPENPVPHTFMGIVAAYQGKVEDALDDFYNARRLAPQSGTSYTNIAETLIYAGRPANDVKSWLSRGEQRGVSPGVVELNYCLLSWRDGRPDAAARHFYRALKLDPEVVRNWNEAPVSSPIRTFEDLTSYCCGSPACGPYLESACQNAERDVARRELPEETALRELRIEMERRRELNRIYQQRKDLEIEVKQPEAPKPQDSSSAPDSEEPANP